MLGDGWGSWGRWWYTRGKKIFCDNIWKMTPPLTYGIFHMFCRVFFWKLLSYTKYSHQYYIQYVDLVLGIFMIYVSLHYECQLHYWASSRVSYHLQGKYRLVTYFPTILTSKYLVTSKISREGQREKSLSHINASYPCLISMPLIHVSYPCLMSMSHIHVSYLCLIRVGWYPVFGYWIFDIGSCMPK